MNLTAKTVFLTFYVQNIIILLLSLLIVLVLFLYYYYYYLLQNQISTSNHMFRRANWNKLPECIFGNFGIARLKQGQFQNSQKSRGDSSQKSLEPN